MHLCRLLSHIHLLLQNLLTTLDFTNHLLAVLHKQSSCCTSHTISLLYIHRPSYCCTYTNHLLVLLKQTISLLYFTTPTYCCDFTNHLFAVLHKPSPCCTYTNHLIVVLKQSISLLYFTNYLLAVISQNTFLL